MSEAKFMIDYKCPKCDSNDWGLSNTGMPHALECLDCGEVYSAKGEWVEITKGQIDDCLKHSDNYDFAWAIEHICRLNNGYPAHENFRPEVSGSTKWSKSK